jgi:preprotein translocase subunit SecG
MSIAITIVHIIVCLILILVILLQAGRGQGLTGPSFGSGNVQSLFGTGAGDFLTKATSVAAVLFILTSISLDVLEVRKTRSLLEFSGAPQVDVESIKQALEKVKAEAGTEAAKKDAAAPAAVTAASVTESAAQEGQNPNALTTTSEPNPVSTSSAPEPIAEPVQAPADALAAKAADAIESNEAT